MDLNMLSRSIAEQDSLRRDQASTKPMTALRGRLRPRLAGAIDAETSPRPCSTAPHDARRVPSLAQPHGERETRSLALNHQVARVPSSVKAGKYEVEWHKKFSIPFACTVFVLIGMPLAVVSARGGRGVSVGMSIAAFFLYYVLLSTGEKLADRGHRAALARDVAAEHHPRRRRARCCCVQSVQETRLIDFRLPDWLARLLGRKVATA